jgi:hypothetical protein
MEQRQDAKPADQSATAERSKPIPLADRRRLTRPATQPLKPGQIFTDWASI